MNNFLIEKVSRRTSNHELIPSKEEDADQNRIDLNFGEIHEEVKAPNYKFTTRWRSLCPMGFLLLGHTI